METSTKICPENPNLVKIRQNWGTLHKNLHVFHIVGSNIRSATINTTYCCVFVSMLPLLSILLTVTHVHQKYKEEAMLRFHGNSGHAKAP
jgi:hypothetical protein